MKNSLNNVIRSYYIVSSAYCSDVSLRIVLHFVYLLATLIQPICINNELTIMHVQYVITNEACCHIADIDMYIIIILLVSTPPPF